MKVSPVRPVGVWEIECKRRCEHRLIASIGLQVRLRDGTQKKRDTMKVSPVRPVGVREIECKRRCEHRLIASNMLRIFAPAARRAAGSLAGRNTKKERHHEGVSLFW